jgi:hypothetical protein
VFIEIKHHPQTFTLRGLNDFYFVIVLIIEVYEWCFGHEPGVKIFQLLAICHHSWLFAFLLYQVFSAFRANAILVKGNLWMHRTGV